MKFLSTISFSMALVTLLLGSCTKDPAYLERTDSKDNAVVYLKQGTLQSVDLQLFPFVDEARSVSLNAGFGALGYPDSDLTIHLEVDTRAFDSINAIRQAAGLDLYEAFPSDAYQLEDRELKINGGTLTSERTELKYYPKKFDPAKSYLLPVSITEASGYTINPKARTAFIIASKLEGKPANTEGWEATASTEMVEWENTGLASAIIDGNINTIWHSMWWPEEPPYPHWLAVDMKEEYYVDKIGLVARQNNTRGFTRFHLEASRDGLNWAMLLENVAFDPANRSQQTFALEPAPWKHFKLTMTEGVATSTHLAEFVVYKY